MSYFNKNSGSTDGKSCLCNNGIHEFDSHLCFRYFLFSSEKYLHIWTITIAIVVMKRSETLIIRKRSWKINIDCVTVNILKTCVIFCRIIEKNTSRTKLNPCLKCKNELYLPDLNWYFPSNCSFFKQSTVNFVIYNKKYILYEIFLFLYF